MSELVVDNLTITLRKENRALVSGLSFRLGAGESLVLLGQSGCGKSMSCRAVMGLLDRRFAVDGSITLDGTELTGLRERERSGIYGRRIAFIPQNPMTALDPSVPVERQMGETLSLHTNLSRAQRRGRLRQALAGAGLGETERVCASRPGMLSGGMLQRVLIAMALSTGAELVIADEPTTALDVVHRNEIVDTFAALQERGMSVLFVTHDFAAALRLDGKILVMRDGAVVERGSTREVYALPRHEYTKALVRAAALSKGAGHADR